MLNDEQRRMYEEVDVVYLQYISVCVKGQRKTTYKIQVRCEAYKLVYFYIYNYSSFLVICARPLTLETGGLFILRSGAKPVLAACTT
jgi:hypothetical protein